MAHLLLANLTIPAWCTLRLQGLDSALERGAECARLRHKVIELRVVLLRCSIVHVVQRPRMQVTNSGDIIVEPSD